MAGVLILSAQAVKHRWWLSVDGAASILPVGMGGLWERCHEGLVWVSVGLYDAFVRVLLLVGCCCEWHRCDGSSEAAEDKMLVLLQAPGLDTDAVYKGMGAAQHLKSRGYARLARFLHHEVTRATFPARPFQHTMHAYTKHGASAQS